MDKKNTPEVKLGQYKGLAVTRHVRPVTDKTVDIELVHQARMHAVYHPTTEPAKRGFRALLDFAGYMDGKEIPDSRMEKVMVVLGDGKLMPAAEQAIYGHKAGETFRFDFTYPAAFRVPELSGKTAQFEIKLHSVAEKTTPELNEEFARAQGYADLAAMREAVRAKKRKIHEDAADRAAGQELLAKAGANLTVTVPEAVLDRTADNEMKLLSQRLSRSGISMEQHCKNSHTTPEALRQRYRDEAESRVRVMLAARAIAESETVWMLAGPADAGAVQAEFAGDENIHVLTIETDDAWARDVGPTCVVDDHGTVRGVDWQFNAWGGMVDGLYAHWEKDNAAARAICAALGMDCYDAQHFVLEGGSIHSDGEGTILATEACLLSRGRNPELSRAEIEQELKNYLGAQKIVWLPRGIYNDETNEHVDNVCAYVGSAEVVLAWTEDENDPQYALSRASLDALEAATDAKGRHFTVHKLPIPAKPICVTEEELQGYAFEEGEDTREAGERLAASYVNFYISNGGIILPQYGDANDALAVQQVQAMFPDRRVVGAGCTPSRPGAFWWAAATSTASPSRSPEADRNDMRRKAV